MKFKSEQKKIGWLIDMFKAHRLTASHEEYQRGLVWDDGQQKHFIDSILRGYPIPMIFLYHVEASIHGEEPIETYEIIDGQQRINALYRFREGSFSLYDPNNEKETKFPNFQRGETCDWANEKFLGLDIELQKSFLDIHMPVATIEKSTPKNEVRDMFIRLQGGVPLNDQEKRDAWPGDYTKFILDIGGKKEVAKYPGEDFFRKYVGKSDKRGNRRQLAAQMHMLYSSYSDNLKFTNIGKNDIDKFYKDNLQFDSASEKTRKFKKILKIMDTTLEGCVRTAVPNHAAIHMCLFIGSMMDDHYKQDAWKKNWGECYMEFMEKFSRSKKNFKDFQKQDSFYTRYIAHTSHSSNAVRAIEIRNTFFFSEMLELLKKKDALIAVDSQRAFGNAEKDYIFFRDQGLCLMCQKSVSPHDIEIHHLIRHADGGATNVDNGALVHKSCHPRKQEEEKKAIKLFENKREAKEQREKEEEEKEARTRTNQPKVKLPLGTEVRMFYKGKKHNGRIGEKGIWLLENGETATAPSGAATAITGINLNGYKYWEVKLPKEENWIPIEDIRDRITAQQNGNDDIEEEEEV